METAADLERPVYLQRRNYQSTAVNGFTVKGGMFAVREGRWKYIEAEEEGTHELYDEFSSKNAKFKQVYDHWKAFRDEQYLWFRVAELTYENFAFTAGQTVK